MTAIKVNDLGELEAKIMPWGFDPKYIAIVEDKYYFTKQKDGTYNMLNISLLPEFYDKYRKMSRGV